MENGESVPQWDRRALDRLCFCPFPILHSRCPPHVRPPRPLPPARTGCAGPALRPVHA